MSKNMTIDDLHGADVIDIRDVIARVEELQNDEHKHDPDESAEWARLESLLDDLKSSGSGDEQWRGDWYPVTLIRDSYFEDYARETADDMHGSAIHDLAWPMNHIDWAEAAGELQQDYSSVEFDGITYWYHP